MKQIDESSNPGVAIIGYGTAGVNALIALRNAGYSGPVDVFTDSSIPPYSPILTSYYAGGMKPREACFPWSEDELGALEARVHYGYPVVELDPEAHTLRTDEGSFPYAKCIIASGSRPMPYGFPADCGYTPIQLRTLDDAERLKAALNDDGCEHLLVSGASMVALKTVEAALEQGVKVTLVGLNPHVLDFNALPQTAELFEQGLEALGVELKLGSPIKTVELDDSGPRHKLNVCFADGSTGTYDDISVAHGMRSNLDFLPQGALEMDRALLVDEFMRTSDPDVYAAGDVAQALELVSGQRRIVGIWKNAARQGEAAGWAIAAELAGGTPHAEHAYTGSISTNTITVENMLFISAGTMELSEGRSTEMRSDGDMTVLYIFEGEGAGRRLVGFNLVSTCSDEGGKAYDTGAMLTMRIEQAHGK